jgi:hypothetical protein
LSAFQEGNSCLLSPGAPASPVHHRTLSGTDLLPYLAKPTIGTWEPLAHRTLSGAPFRPLARPRVSRGSRGRPLARPTVGSPDTIRCTPDSTVNYSRMSLITSREQQVRLSQPGAPDTVRCTPDSPVPPSDHWLGHVSRADRATDRWPGRALAHRTVRCTPDSPVNYSRTPLITSREQQVRLSQPGAPDTVWCTTRHCLLHPDRADFG